MILTKIKFRVLILSLILSTTLFAQPETLAREKALENGKLVNQGFNRCVNYVNAWIKYADPATGLIPRNLTDSKDYWNAWDAAADNYPFMVLTSSILMPDFFKNEALNMLKTERALTPRIGKLPDSYSFTKKGFKEEMIDSSKIVFGSAEYMKDGLIPITEWLGKSPWSNRMLEILDDVPLVSRLVTQVKGNWLGNSATVEVNGDLLQVLSRMYWFTGKKEYLDWGIEIADYYLNDERLPTKASSHLRIRDHGCEIISGLCEIYLAAHYAAPEKKEAWKPYIHSMLNRILEVGRNEDGLFYDEVNPLNGTGLTTRLADNFGYTYNAFYSVYLIDSVPAYREALVKALSSLNSNYRNHNWENGSADGYADAIEGTLNLYNREPIASVESWLDSEIHNLWKCQKTDGMIEGWHGDGNFARTTIMYCLWKTQGIAPVKWNKNLQLGAVRENGKLIVALNNSESWSGTLKFDAPRYKDLMGFPIDYPRINQYQQWYTIDKNKSYIVKLSNSPKIQIVKGKTLLNGYKVSIKANKPLFITLNEK